MTTSVERAAEAFATYGLFPSEPERYGEPARAVLTAALDRDEIARVIRAQAYGFDGRLPAVNFWDDDVDEYALADAVIAHLLREG